MRPAIAFSMICLCVCFVMGCGGGDAASDSGAVAQNEGGGGADSAAPSSGGPSTGMSGGAEMGGGADMGGGGEATMGGADMAGGAEMGYPGEDGGASADPGADLGALPGGDPAAGADPTLGADAAGYDPGAEPGAYPGGIPGGDPASGADPAGYDPNAEPGGDYPGGLPGAVPGVPGSYDPNAEPGGDYAGGIPGAELPEDGAGGAYPGGLPGDGADYEGRPGRGSRVESEEPPKGFDGAAQVAFRSGRDKEALQYLYAHALSSDAGAADLLTGIGWVPGLRRPAMAVRFGVGVDLIAPRNVNDYKPIGDSQKLPEKRSSRNRREGDFGGEGGGGDLGGDFGGAPGAPGGDFGDQGRGDLGARGSHPAVAKFAGDLGDQIVSKFRERVQRGDFGKPLKDAPQSGRRREGGGEYGGPGLGGPGLDGDPGAYPGGVPGSEAGLGEPGLGAAPGGDYPGAPGGEGGYGGEGAAEGAGGNSITTGLTFIGTGKDRELIEKARQEEVDVLIVFKVKVGYSTKTGLVTNETEVGLYDVQKGRPIMESDEKTARPIKTRPLNNVRVQIARGEGKDDGVQEEIDDLFKAIDERLTLSSFPTAISPQVIQGRASALATQKHDNLLPVLSELRFWNRKNLLDDAQMEESFAQLIDAELAKSLAGGSEEERKMVVERWLPGKGG